jgi:hypothetical protein
MDNVWRGISIGIGLVLLTFPAIYVAAVFISRTYGWYGAFLAFDYGIRFIGLAQLTLLIPAIIGWTVKRQHRVVRGLCIVGVLTSAINLVRLVVLARPEIPY